MYRPITEHGALSEVMAAVLYLPSMDGDGGVKSLFFFLAASGPFSVGEKLLLLLLPMARDRIDPNRQLDD